MVERNSNNPRLYSKLMKCVSSWARAVQVLRGVKPDQGLRGRRQVQGDMGRNRCGVPVGEINPACNDNPDAGRMRADEIGNLLVDLLCEGYQLTHCLPVALFIDEHKWSVSVRLHPEKSVSKRTRGTCVQRARTQQKKKHGAGSGAFV